MEDHGTIGDGRNIARTATEAVKEGEIQQYLQSLEVEVNVLRESVGYLLARLKPIIQEREETESSNAEAADKVGLAYPRTVIGSQIGSTIDTVRVISRVVQRTEKDLGL